VRAAVYLRQSQDRTGEQLGIDRQRADVEATTCARGWTVVETFVDNDTSATSRKPRPAFVRMMKAVDDGVVDVICARHMDRLLRRLSELEDVLARCERHGVHIATAADGVDTSTDGGRLVARILSSVAQGEVERKSARQMSSNEQAATAGRYVGGRRAFGYEQDGMTVRENEAALVRQGYADVLAGVSLAAIAREWNAAGHTTPQGRRNGDPKSFDYNAVHVVLGNPRNAGLRRRATADLVDGRRDDPLTGIVGAAAWPPLVPEETYRAVVEIITHPDRHKGPRGAQRLLTGVGVCGICGATVHGGSSKPGNPVYKCSALPHLTRRGDHIDEYVTGVVLGRLSRPDALDLLPSGEATTDVAALRTEASAVRARLHALATDFADGELSTQQLRAANTRLRAKLADTEAQMATVGRPDLLGALVGADDIERLWATYSADRKRAIIAELLTPVLLSPGRGKRNFDPESLRIEWKGQR